VRSINREFVSQVHQPNALHVDGGGRGDHKERQHGEDQKAQGQHTDVAGVVATRPPPSTHESAASPSTGARDSPDTVTSSGMREPTKPGTPGNSTVTSTRAMMFPPRLRHGDSLQSNATTASSSSKPKS